MLRGAAATFGVVLPVSYFGTSPDTSLRQASVELITGRPLNTKSFEPFTITAREQVSPTSFVIAVRPSNGLPVNQWPWPAGFLGEPHPHQAVISKAWDYGLWHVEVKHPLIQVAREYTPLPPREGQEEHDLDKGILRFLIRTVDGGEVSHYLASRRVGDQIELRGPHLGFDVRKRLGNAGHLVFIAGGTGIAPALQVVRAVLDQAPRAPAADIDATATSSIKPNITILWANRRNSDCRGCGVLSTEAGRTPSLAESMPNVIIEQLADMKRRHRDLLTVLCTVDQESQFIDAAAITAAAKKGSSRLDNPVGESRAEARCDYHSSALLLNSDGYDSARGSCACSGPGAAYQPGKKLVMVSGPDGFVANFAGPKRWTEGKERQGPVGGLLGQLTARYPGVWNEWLVLKL